MNKLNNEYDRAFNQAIDDNRLSEYQSDDNYVGDYMYMYTDDNNKDIFKNINTRQYLS